MTDKYSIIMTRSMERVLREKKLPLETALDFPQMYKLFSSNDLAAFVALQTMEELRSLHDAQGCALETIWSNNFRNTFPELSATILPMSHNPALVVTLREQLSVAPGAELDKDAAYVQIFDTAREAFFIVVDNGAVDYMRHDVNAIAVTRAIMKVLLNYMPLAVLARGNKMFKRWIRLAAVNNVLRPPQPVIE